MSSVFNRAHFQYLKIRITSTPEAYHPMKCFHNIAAFIYQNIFYSNIIANYIAANHIIIFIISTMIIKGSINDYIVFNCSLKALTQLNAYSDTKIVFYIISSSLVSI